MQLLPTLSVAVAALAQLTAAAPTANGSPVLVRHEWRTLSKVQQLEYLSAVKCMQNTPPRTKALYSGVQNRYDDFVALHINMTDQIHFVGQFLPYHRGLLALFEADLKNTCGYKGAVPYWDWSLDSTSVDSFAQSPIFDATYGFGGNGQYLTDAEKALLVDTAALVIPNTTGGGCVTTGPFANVNASMGPGSSTDYTPHCLRRDFSGDFASQSLNSSLVDIILSTPDFLLLDRRFQSLELDLAGVWIHGGGHFSVGGNTGDMSDMWSSPSDPLFWSHHAMLDNVWNQWQRLNWTVRKAEITGPDTMWAYPYNYFGDVPYKNITLAFELAYGQLGETVNISQVMDTTNMPCDVNSYTYA
ncbi:hypothetical protein BP6252_11107 [Coleophoma cylindrospora]|uniref:Tyrosinase copper-binding domain-containing protein n=1 Tax=Coleophoma cylindrospora TaxID=1849047 RepID=A0A3D8QP40_9HELO|nr:hypothetical protein BP6252_11107 [Coleophoma cylindrospora]